MIVTLYRPHKYVSDAVSAFTTTSSDDCTMIKVYDVDTVFISHGTLVLTGAKKDEQALIDTRLYCYFDCV